MKYFVVLTEVWRQRADEVIQVGKLYQINDNGTHQSYTAEDGTPGLVYPLLRDEHVFDADFFN